jgi:hypothetical protein
MLNPNILARRLVVGVDFESARLKMLKLAPVLV